MRQTLLSAITTAVSTLTQFAVSQELPWAQNGDALFRKNMKKIYVDQPTLEQSTFIFVFDKNNVNYNDYTYNIYFAVDAKNPPSQTDQVVAKIMTCMGSTGLLSLDDESDYTVEKDEDKVIYSVQIRSRVAST